jgi:hypothetical protein
MFRTLHGQLITVRRAMAADTLLLAELFYRLNQFCAWRTFQQSQNRVVSRITFHNVLLSPTKNTVLPHFP